MNHASWMLVAVTALWGFSFTWTKAWQDAAEKTLPCPGGELLSALTLIALRMPLALLMLGVARPSLVLNPTRKELSGGVVLGLVFLSGFILQTWALAGTTPALSGFFTSLCSVWVPFLALALGDRVRLPTVVGLAVAAAGCAALVWTDDKGWKFGWGEWLTAAASVIFAVQLMMLDRIGKGLEPAHLSAGFFAAIGGGAFVGAVLVAAAGPGLGAWLAWAGRMLALPWMAVYVLSLASFPTVLAFHWMNEFQPKVDPSRAALIYLLEPVFTAVVSVISGYDEITYPLVLGGLLILAGNAVVALGEARSGRIPHPPDAPPAGG